MELSIPAPVTKEKKEKRKPGRPVGSISRRNRILRRITNEQLGKINKVPLTVMLKNMDKFDEEADHLQSKLVDLIDNCRPPKSASRNEHKEFLGMVKDLMSKMRDCRMDAQRCAVDAAPYMHSRLASITVKQENNQITAKPEMQQSEEELADYFSKLRTRPATVEPLIIDNETGAPMAPVDDYEYEQ